MKLRRFLSLLCTAHALAAVHAPADVKLPAIFSDHMVVRAAASVAVWGFAEPGEDVNVALAGESAAVGAGTDGDGMVLTFDHSIGLKASPGELQGFAIAGSDQKFVWAKATVDGGKITVSSDSVHEPAAVRYAWAGNPKCNLVNAAGLPASPFRTDDWK